MFSDIQISIKFFEKQKTENVCEIVTGSSNSEKNTASTVHMLQLLTYIAWRKIASGYLVIRLRAKVAKDYTFSSAQQNDMVIFF